MQLVSRLNFIKKNNDLKGHYYLCVFKNVLTYSGVYGKNIMNRYMKGLIK